MTATMAARNPNGPRNIVKAAAYISATFEGMITCGKYPKKKVAPTITPAVIREVKAAE